MPPTHRLAVHVITQHLVYTIVHKMTTRTVLLEVTSEQEETIKALFAHNDWNYKELEQKAQKKRTSKQKKQTPPPPVPEPEPEPEPEQPNREPLDGECQHCFLNPCVSSKDYYWLGNGQYPSIDNSAIRRAKYASFWKVMTNLGAWNDTRYRVAKIARANGGEWAVHHRREVMPLCVLQKLRSLYPNPKEMPYMDHKWQ